MDTKITEIEILLDKLNLLFGTIKNDGRVDKLELELLKRYVQQLQDKVQSIEVKNPPLPVPQPIIEPVLKQEEPTVEKVIVPIIEEKKTIENNNQTNKSDEEIIETAPPVILPPVKIEQPEIKKVDAPEIKQPEKKKLIAQDDDNEDAAYNSGLNNKLFKDKKTLADKIISAKSKDIKSIIDLNDKLFFISKLFKGDKDAYDQSIKTLNTFATFTEANQFVQFDLKTKFQWKDGEAFERLIEVVRSKFE